METADRKILALKNTRRLLLELTNRGDAERFIEAINARRVKLLDDDTFVDAETGEVLGKRLRVFNDSDYEVDEDQWRPRTGRNSDPFDYGYNDI